MNKSAKGGNIVSVILTILVISIYLIPNFASAISVAISDIANTNKGNDIRFSVTIDILDTDRYVPISSTNLTIQYTGSDQIDKLECEIQPAGEYTCYRTKGNHTAEFTAINITATKDESLGYGYGDGYGYGYGYSPSYGYGYGYEHNFGYGYGYGYGNGEGNFGKITYNVLWHTPVNLQPGIYSATARLFAEDKIFTSGSNKFDVFAPAIPVQSHNQSVNIPANQGTTVDASAVDTILSILTGTDAVGLITLDKYDKNPTSSASIPGKALNKFIAIQADSSIEDNLVSAIINVSYTDGEVSGAGLVESTLRLYFFNPSTGGWEVFDPPNGNVDTTNNYVWANTSHFSIWGIFGSAPAAPSSPSGGSGGPGSGGGGGGVCAPGYILKDRKCVKVEEETVEETPEEEEEEEEEEVVTAPAEEAPEATPPAKKTGLGAITGALIGAATGKAGIGSLIIITIVGSGLFLLSHFYGSMPGADHFTRAANFHKRAQKAYRKGKSEKAEKLYKKAQIIREKAEKGLR